MSIYLINISFVNSFIQSVNKSLTTNNVSVKLNKKDKHTKSESIKIKLAKEESKPSLVETIEELGFIPSLDQENDSHAA